MWLRERSNRSQNVSSKHMKSKGASGQKGSFRKALAEVQKSCRLSSMMVLRHWNLRLIKTMVLLPVRLHTGKPAMYARDSREDSIV